MAEVQSTVVEERLRKFTEACRTRGLKITPQRLEIFRELAGTTEHPSVEDIFERLRQRMPTVSLDTVYRTLATLNETGVVSRVEVLDDRCRFDANTERHHHFVCIRCKRVVDFQWPGFDHLQIPDELRGVGVIHQPHAELRGICKSCLKK